MKKTVNKEVHFCDKCNAEQVYGFDECLCCGVEHCYECKKTEGRKYSHGVHVSGSGDGYYCNACDAKLLSSGEDKLHSAYRRVASLRAEAIAWSDGFDRRRNAAEMALSELAAHHRFKPLAKRSRIE